MKKFLLIVSALLIVLSFTGCKLLCNHEYGEWTVTKPATCIEEGEQVRVCALCSNEETAAIEMVAHTEVYDMSIAATCTEGGLSWGKHCSVCGLVTIERTENKPRGHVMSREEVVREATCTEEGEVVRYCEKCDYQEHVVVEKIDHKPFATYLGWAATCLKRGLTDGAKCAICGEMYIKPELQPILEHVAVEDKGYPATETSEGLTDGQHCSVCNSVLVPQRTIPKLGTAQSSFVSGYVTSTTTVVQTKHLDIIIEENIFVPDNLAEIVDVFTTAIEELSGLHFKEDPIPVYVKHDSNAFASRHGANIYSTDILDCSTLVHEVVHVLHFDQSAWYFNQWAAEGITTYTKYKLRLYIEENYPDLVEYIGTHNDSIVNYEIPDYALLYAHTMDYWIDNLLEGGNKNYSLGFRLMWFLDQTYGNYVDWIYRMEEAYPAQLNMIGTNNSLPKEKHLEAFYMAYGEDVFAKFYAWLKDNEDIFAEYRPIDLRGADSFNSYPAYSHVGWFLNSINTECILYNDLYIGLDAGKKYLGEYKGKNINDLTLDISKSATVALYDEKGNLIKISEGVANSGKSEFKTLNLDGVSYIQLVGEGELYIFEIKGFK